MRTLTVWLQSLTKGAFVETRGQGAPEPGWTANQGRLEQSQGGHLDQLPGSRTNEPAHTVADIVANGTDLAGNEIICVYSKVPPQYAVYLTRNRVAVQYADDPKKADEQRKYMVSLNALRTQIDGLVSGWRMSRMSKYRLKARKYDARVAAALVLCLEGDGETPRTTLSDIREDILAERTSWGRFEYLIAASIAAIVAIVLFFCIQRQLLPFKLPSGDLWLATRAGTVGAFFSIALAIRGRTVLTNLRRRDNVADAILRIAIGTIAAGVLLLLMQAGILPKLQIGEGTASGQTLVWQAVLVVGFLAGFSERLVPDLLAKAGNQDSTLASKSDSSSDKPAGAPAQT